MNEYMQEYFEFLTNLRDGGTMNMMGAPRELQLNFGLNKADARDVFQKWCESLAQSQPPLPAQRSAAISQKSPRRFSACPPRRGYLVK